MVFLTKNITGYHNKAHTHTDTHIYTHAHIDIHTHTHIYTPLTNTGSARGLLLCQVAFG